MWAGDQQTNGGQIGKTAPPVSKKCHSHPNWPFFKFSITFLNPTGRLCTNHTQTDANIHTDVDIFHILAQTLVILPAYGCVWVAFSQTWCTQTTACANNQESEGRPQNKKRSTSRYTIHDTRPGCLSSVDRLVCKLQSLDSTHWLKPWKICFLPSGFHMSFRNNPLLLAEDQKNSSNAKISSWPSVSSLPEENRELSDLLKNTKMDAAWKCCCTQLYLQLLYVAVALLCIKCIENCKKKILVFILDNWCNSSIHPLWSQQPVSIA